MKNALAVSIVGVVCSGCFADGPPTGSCDGTIGTKSVSGAIDASSEFHVRNKTSCLGVDITLFHLSYGGSALKVTGEKTGLVSILEGRKAFALPLSGGDLTQWSVSAGGGEPAVTSGTVHLEREASSRVSGDFTIDYADGSHIACELSLPVQSDLNEGDRPDCGGGSGAGGDFDD